MRKRLWLILTLFGLLTACATPSAATPTLPPDVPLRSQLVWRGSYAQDIQPVFQEACVECHGPARAENGLRLDTYEGVMKGTQYGAVVKPGSAAASTLAYVIQGTAPQQVRMPHQGVRLSPNRIQNIILWIDAGVPRE